MRELGVDLKQEDDATEFLGVTLERNPETNLLEIKQTGLIKRVIKALGLDDGIVKEKYTPSESKPLVKNLHGEAASRAFSYSRVVGHNHPDITLLPIVVLDTSSVLNISMSYLKRLGRYLIQTSDRAEWS